LLKIYEKIKNNPASAEKQSLKFSTKVLKKAAASATQLAKCILLHAIHVKLLALSCASTNKIFISLIKQAGITMFWVIN